jgi:hypothetical protein
MFFRRVLAVFAVLAFALPAAAQDEAALIQKRQQVREMARDALTLSGTKFFKDPDLP